MMNTLSRIREENGTSEKSRTYYSIIRTGQLIPYDSAIFLSTDVLPNDDDHRQSASMILLKKRIRVRIQLLTFMLSILLIILILYLKALPHNFR
jgi:predicted nucleic acid-binding Zn ribbon protein